MAAAFDFDLALSRPDLVKTELAKRELRHFIKQAWPIVEPDTVYMPNWHIDVICEYLKAVDAGEIKRLVITMPPRFMKSTSVSVMWPAYKWISNPGHKFLTTSYAQTLSRRDSSHMRLIVQSDWYREAFQTVNLRDDANNVDKFVNDMGGYRIATSFGGKATGEGGDTIIADDAHNLADIISDTVREKVIEIWDTAMSSRLNNPKTGAKVVVMQRGHEYDLAGHCLKELGYEHLKIQQEYCAKQSVEFKFSEIEDPRIEEGELLWPERAGPVEVAQFKNDLGSYNYANQHQQEPVPKEGGMFNVTKIQMVSRLPSPIKRIVRAWDKAATQDGGCFTSGVLIAELESGQFIILHAHNGQWSKAPREANMKMIAEQDFAIWGNGQKGTVQIVIEQEGGSGGKDSVEDSIVNLKGFRAKGHRETGDKVIRADTYSGQMQIGNILMMRDEATPGDPWNTFVKESHRLFPRGKIKDPVDAASLGYRQLTRELKKKAR